MAVKFSSLPPIPRRPVELSSGTVVELRALTLTDIMSVVHDMGPAFVSMFSSLMELSQAGTLTHQHVRDALLRTISESPKLVGRIIAASNDDPTEAAVEAILGLPAVDQVLCLLVVGEETFKSEAHAKKLLAPLAMVAPIISAALPKTTQPQRRHGIGGSAGRRPS